MARRKTDPVLQKVRLLVRSGHRREAAAELESAIKLNPNHAKARDELARYLTNKPFSFEEKDYKELQKLIADFVTTPHLLQKKRKSVLKNMKHRVGHLERSLTHLLTSSDQKITAQLKAAITRELQRRGRPVGKVLTTLGLAFSGICAIGGLACFLSAEADKAAIALENECKIFRKESAQKILLAHDTGLNRTFNRRVAEQASRLRLLLQMSEQHTRDIDALLKPIEAGKQSVVGLGIRQRTVIERRLRELGENGTALRKRWENLCRKEAKELSQQRMALAQELMAPLPESVQLSGDADADLKLVTSRLQELQQRLLIYEDAAEALQLSNDIQESLRQETEHLIHIRSEINIWRNLLQELPSVQTYERYAGLLRGINPSLYKPAVDILTVREILPQEDNLQGLIVEKKHELQPGVLQVAKEALMEGCPTFSALAPATAEQLHLLQELLSNSALNTRLYELTNTVENLEAYSEKLPELRYGRACFRRSALDPSRDITENKNVEWQNPLSVTSRTVDPSPLFQALGMQNSSAFISSFNIQVTITRLLQHSHPDVPALAKAYILHYLLQVINHCQYPMLNGLRFAPEMRRIITDFETKAKGCNIKLDGNCWLKRTPAHNAAENLFRRWFRKHSKVDFAGEVRQNLGKLLAIRPQYCGYINQNGEMIYSGPLNEGQLIWYLSEGVMTATAWGSPLQTPVRLSPVFTME